MLTPSEIFIELKYSTLVSNLNGLMRHILCLICVSQYCKFTVPLVKKLCYHKKAFIWHFIFVCSVVSEHDFISNFIVIVNSMFILSGVISIGLRLFLPSY